MRQGLLRVLLLGLALQASPGLAEDRQPLILAPARTDIVASNEVVPPPELAKQAKADAVVLKPVPLSEAVRTLKIKRREPLLATKSHPQIALGTVQLDVTPLFENPDSLVNIARRLSAMDMLVSQASVNGEVIETDRGVIVSQYLGYQLRGGACANAASRKQLETAGTPCFDRLDGEAGVRRLADPNDPRFIADPGLRVNRATDMRAKIAAERDDLAGGMAQFRTMLADPVRRAEIEAEMGRAEVVRLAGLDDAALEEEIIQSAMIEVEELMFVPTADDPQIAAMVSPDEQLKRRLPSLSLPQKVTVDTEHKLEEHVLLAGFTLGRQMEWSRRVSITINVCVVSCKRTYYLEGFAGFGYGIGLRFPIRMGGTYAYHRVGDAEAASIAPVFVPVDATVQDYAESGLSGSQQFRGQELVAELGGYAGLRYKVPFKSDEFRIDVGGNLADELPAPFKGGNFRPPAPGDADAPEQAIIFPKPDLLAGLGNYGFVGIQLLPAVKLGLRSNRLRLLLADKISGRETWMESSGQVYPLAVDPADHSSRFSIGRPEYNLSFDLTPGLNPQLFVDIAVWGHDWNWQVWFPQIKVALPPQGLDFACHKDTVCTREYRYSPTVSEDVAGTYSAPKSAQEREVLEWRKSFEEQYAAQCPYAPLRLCEVAIRGVADRGAGQMLSMLDTLAAIGSYPSDSSRETMASMKIAVDIKAKQVIYENRRAEIARYGRTVFGVYEAFWSAGCVDKPCRDAIQSMGKEYVVALQNRWAAAQALTPQEVVMQENQQGDWAQRAKEAAEASRRRALPRSQRLKVQSGKLRLPK